MKKYGLVSFCWLYLTVFLLVGGCSKKNEDGTHGQEAANQAQVQKVSKESETSSVPIELVEVAERSLDNKPAIAITFSTPLSPSRSYDSFITVTQQNGEPAKGAWVLGDNRRVLYFPHIQPEVTYRVQVQRGLPAANGTEISAASEHSVTTRRIVPGYGFASKGSVLPMRLTDGLPIITVNVPEVDIEFMRVKDDELAQFIDAYDLDEDRVWQLDQYRAMLESVYAMRFTTKGEPNARTISHVPVEDIKELKRPGFYIAVMREPGRFNSYEYKVTHFFVSDIGLHVRAYKQRMDVYANSLKTGKPLPDVAVELYDRKGNSKKKVFTDAEGHAGFDFPLAQRDLMIARQGEQISVLSFREPALDLSEFDIKGPAHHALETYLYSSRDLYRPGETVDVSALLRDHDGRAVQGQPLAATLKRPDGRVMGAFTWQSQELGYYQRNLNLPFDAQTGQWSLEVRTDPASKEPNQVLRFKVEEFLPERMKLALESAQEYLRPDETFAVNVAADYLYGAPAAGNRFKATLNVHRDESPLRAALPGFVFGDVNDTQYKRREELPEMQLDAKGRTKIELRPFEARPNSPMLVRITGEVYESGGRPVARSINRTVWPADALVGIRPQFTGEYADTNSLARFEVVKANPKGELLAASGLDVTVIREDRDYYWSYDENRGWHYEYSESNYPIHRQSLNIAKGGKAELGVQVEWGAYRIDIQDPETGLTMRYRFHAGWNWRDEGSDSSRPDKVALSLDKPAYRPGDTVKLKVVAPHPGEALILVESDRPLWQKRLTIPAEGRTVEIPVAQDWNSHNLYISATVFRPGDAEDKITPNRALGLIHLPLDRSERRLEVAVEAQDKMRPDRPLDVSVQLKELKGQTAYVTLSAVDVGILNITNFTRPDPFDFFFAKRGYGVDSYDLYGKVIENLKGVRAALRFGGDADAAGLKSSKRSQARVKTVALFSGPVKVDEKGIARISVPVPDFNGTLRLMAVAFTDDRFGSAEREVVVAAPLVAELAMPRFLAAGDQSQVTLDLHNLSDRDQSFRLEMSASTPLGLDPVTRTVPLHNQEKTTLTFPIRGEEAFGVGDIRIKVKGEDVDLERHWELGVRPAYPGLREVKQVKLNDGDTLTLDPAWTAELMDKTAQVNLLVSNLPPLDIRSAVEHLLHYPYGCLEQTTSAAFPHLYVDEAKARAFGLQPLSWAERSKRVEDALMRLAGMQLPGGGFGLWNNTSPEEPWLTPYVVHFMLDARDQGFTVPDAMLQRALDNLLQRLQSGGGRYTADRYSESPQHLTFAGNAYAAYVLARVQRAPLGTLRIMYDHHRAQAESGLPLVHLGLALMLQGDQQRGMAAISEGIAKPRKEKWYLGDYGSDVRDLALMYALLDKHNVAVEGQDGLLFKLGGLLPNAPYLSTQERFAVFLAGQGLATAKGQPWQGELSMGGAVENVNAEGRWQHSFTVDELKRGVRFVSRAPNAVYAEAEITGYTRKPPAPKLDVINIMRGLYTPEGKPVSVDRPLHVGDLFVVHLRVESHKRIEDALVVDLLPAGLEIENLNLAQGETLEDMRINNVSPVEAMTANNIKHQEYREDRFAAAVSLSGHGSTHLFYLVRVVSPGTFILPPPYVEDMYRPELRGIGTAVGKLMVENRAR